MRVLVVFAHPVESSFGAALHKEVINTLKEGGHEIDDCDLYAEKFDPILTGDDRIHYHDIPGNRKRVEPYVQRLEKAEAIVFVTPIWNFGWPAILKGYFDRVWLPGVTFDLVNGNVKPKLHNIRKMVAVTTYGANPIRAFIAGNPPKKIITRALRYTIKPFAPVKYLAHYTMDLSTDETRTRYLAKVKKEMMRF